MFMKYKIKTVELTTATLFFPKYRKWYFFKWHFFTDDSGFGNKCFYNYTDAIDFIKKLKK